MDRLTLALLFSLALHLIGWSGYEINKKFDLLQRLYPHAKIKIVPAQPVVQNTEPEIFMDVDRSSSEAPQNAKYYSDKNSRAAGRESGDSNVPKLNGTQTDFMKLENALRSQVSRAQSPSEEQLAKNETQAQSVQAGDWSRVKPQDSPEQKENPEQQPRPRTIRQARAQQSGLMPGPQSQTEDGTRRISNDSSFDVKATPFGDYDRRIITAVQQRWDDLLDSQRFALDRTGKVTVRFNLNYDGSISDVEILQNTVGELLGYVCQQAIAEPAPYEKWPSDMRRMVGANFREITFTFYYY
jgi:outer membrane biosynthesis protein TonB